MSKLFETLDKIQHQEEELPPPCDPVRLSASPRRSLLPLLLGGVALAGAIAVYQYWPAGKTVVATQSPVLTLQKQQVRPTKNLVPPPLPKVSVGDATSYNNMGVAQAKKGQFWEAIFYFEKASQLSPAMIEPLINQGTALLSLNLTYPARRYFIQAYGLDAENSSLWEAIHKAQAAELLTVDFVDSLTNGDF